MISEEKPQIECKVKYEGGCRNAVSDNLQIFDGLANEYSMETCYELCSKEPDCDGFLLGKSGKSNEGYCQTRRAGCKNDNNPTWEYYSIDDCKYSTLS